MSFKNAANDVIARCFYSLSNKTTTNTQTGIWLLSEVLQYEYNTELNVSGANGNFGSLRVRNFYVNFHKA